MGKIKNKEVEEHWSEWFDNSDPNKLIYNRTYHDHTEKVSFEIEVKKNAAYRKNSNYFPKYILIITGEYSGAGLDEDTRFIDRTNTVRYSVVVNNKKECLKYLRKLNKQIQTSFEGFKLKFPKDFPIK